MTAQGGLTGGSTCNTTPVRVLSTITEPETVRRILDALNVPLEPRTAAPARDPTWEQTPLAFDVA